MTHEETATIKVYDIAWQLAYSREYNTEREHRAVVDALRTMCDFTRRDIWPVVVKTARDIDVAAELEADSIAENKRNAAKANRQTPAAR